MMPDMWDDYLPTSEDPAKDELFEVLEKVFQMIEEGYADILYPDLDGVVFSKEKVDEVLQFLDEYADVEIVNHWEYWQKQGEKTKGKPIDLPPRFNSIKGGARLAVVQRIHQILHRGEEPQEVTE